MYKYDTSEQPIDRGRATKNTARLARFLRYFPLVHFENANKCHAN